MTELAHGKVKYGLISGVISCHDRSAKNCQNSCSKCAPRYVFTSLAQVKASRVACSRRRGAVLLKQKLVSRQPVHVWQWPLSKKVVATIFSLHSDTKSKQSDCNKSSVR